MILPISTHPHANDMIQALWPLFSSMTMTQWYNDTMTQWHNYDDMIQPTLFCPPDHFPQAMDPSPRWSRSSSWPQQSSIYLEKDTFADILRCDGYFILLMWIIWDSYVNDSGCLCILHAFLIRSLTLLVFFDCIHYIIEIMQRFALETGIKLALITIEYVCSRTK